MRVSEATAEQFKAPALDSSTYTTALPLSTSQKANIQSQFRENIS